MIECDLVDILQRIIAAIITKSPQNAKKITLFWPAVGPAIGTINYMVTKFKLVFNLPKFP